MTDIDLDALDAKYSRDASGLYRWWAVETIDADVHALLSALTASRVEVAEQRSRNLTYLANQGALNQRLIAELAEVRELLRQCALYGNPPWKVKAQIEALMNRAAPTAAPKPDCTRCGGTGEMDAPSGWIAICGQCDGRGAAAPQPDEPEWVRAAIAEGLIDPNCRTCGKPQPCGLKTLHPIVAAGAGDGEQDTDTTERAA